MKVNDKLLSVSVPNSQILLENRDIYNSCGFFIFPELIVTEVANGFACPAAGEVSNAGSFSRHAHPEDCRKYYICLDGVAREYGCPIGSVFKIGDSDGTGNCEDPEDVPGW